jgi:hypothetical protein
MSKENYLELRNKREAWYKTIGKVYCPCLQSSVVFNSKGFYHMRYDGTGTIRHIREQMYKMGLLPLAIPVIKNASKIYHYSNEYSKNIGKYVHYWALREVVGKQQTTVTVILRKVGTGNLTFHSIMKNRCKIQNGHP